MSIGSSGSNKLWSPVTDYVMKNLPRNFGILDLRTQLSQTQHLNVFQLITATQEVNHVKQWLWQTGQQNPSTRTQILPRLIGLHEMSIQLQRLALAKDQITRNGG